MPFEPPPTIPNRTPLWGVGLRVDAIANRLAVLASDIEDVWLIGAYLGDAVRFLSSVTQGIASLLYEADNLLISIDGWVNEIAFGDFIRTRIRELSVNLAWVDLDATGFVRSVFRGIAWHTNELLDNPWGFVASRLREYNPDLSPLIDNPIGFVLDIFANAYPLLSDFVSNPIGVITDRLFERYPFLDGFFQNPIGFVIDALTGEYPALIGFLSNPIGFFADTLTERYPFFLGFLENPIGYVIDSLLEIIGLEDDAVDNLLTELFISTLARIERKFEQVEGRVIDILCDFILRFI